MKSRIIIALICAFGVLSTNAQTFGIKGGFSWSNLETQDGEVMSDNARRGFTAGVFTNLPLGSALSIQPELLYTQKGTRFEGAIGDVNIEANYIELPVSLQVNLLDPFYFYAGPQLSYLASTQVRYNLTNNNDIIIDGDEDNFERMDVGGVIGIGFKFDVMFIDARFSRGFINFDKERTIESTIDEAMNLQNINFQLTTGVIF